MPILGGWETVIWYGGGPSAATNIGVVTRPDPVLDPALINVRGTGKRGLRNLIVGLKDHRLNIDWVPANTTFITDYQDGSEISTLHYKVGSVGITLVANRLNRLTTSCRAGDLLRCSGEFWAESIRPLDSGCPWGGVEIDDVMSWENFVLKVAPKTDPTNPVVNTKWHEWRYEVRNNLERLANVDTKTTRSIEPRSRDVSGLLVWDLENYDEWVHSQTGFIGTKGEEKFYIQIMEGSNYLLGSVNGVYSQWGRVEAPHGPGDLQLKRFPFTSLDLS